MEFRGFRNIFQYKFLPYEPQTSESIVYHDQKNKDEHANWGGRGKGRNSGYSKLVLPGMSKAEPFLEKKG